jgi:hypothetical protein
MKITVRVAEAGERLLQLENAGRPERQRDADGDDRHGKLVPDEHGDDRAQDQEGDRLVRRWGRSQPPLFRLRALTRAPRRCRS